MATVEKTEYRLENLTCASCAMKFENNVKNLPSVEDAQVISVHLNFRLAAMQRLKIWKQQVLLMALKLSRFKTKKIEPKMPFLNEKKISLPFYLLLFLIAGMIVSFRYTETHPASDCSVCNRHCSWWSGYVQNRAYEILSVLILI